MKLSKILLGKFGEQKVLEIYQMHGFEIIAKNFFNRKGRRLGEIDIVAVRNKHIHFIEVKTRTSSGFSAPVEALTKSKISRLYRIISLFLLLNPQYQNHQPHIDLATVELSQFDKPSQRVKIYSDVIDSTLAEV